MTDKETTELQDSLKEASEIHKMWFGVFGFMSDASRRNFVVTAFVFLLIFGVVSNIMLISAEKTCSKKEQELILRYERKIDTLTERVLKLYQEK